MADYRPSEVPPSHGKEIYIPNKAEQAYIEVQANILYMLYRQSRCRGRGGKRGEEYIYPLPLTPNSILKPTLRIVKQNFRNN